MSTTAVNAPRPCAPESLPHDVRIDLETARRLIRGNFGFDAHDVELWHHGVRKGKRVFLAGRIGGAVVVTVHVPQDGSPAYFFCTRKRKAVNCAEAFSRFSF